MTPVQCDPNHLPGIAARPERELELDTELPVHKVVDRPPAELARGEEVTEPERRQIAGRVLIGHERILSRMGGEHTDRVGIGQRTRGVDGGPPELEVDGVVGDHVARDEALDERERSHGQGVRIGQVQQLRCPVRDGANVGCTQRERSLLGSRGDRY